MCIVKETIHSVRSKQMWTHTLWRIMDFLSFNVALIFFFLPRILPMCCYATINGSKHFLQMFQITKDGRDYAFCVKIVESQRRLRHITLLYLIINGMFTDKVSKMYFIFDLYVCPIYECQGL